MPPPRKPSPRRKDRRSRSHSPRTSYKKRRSPSRDRDRRSSPQRERKRSRSPQRKRSRSHERHASPQRKRSRTPERERLSPQRKKSVSTKRRSSSPHDYDQPIKRQADSTRRSYRSRSRSYSPGPSRKTRESRYEDIPEDVEYSRRQSPSPYGGQMYSDRPSSSKRSTEKSSSRKDVIDMVKIVDTGKKMERLNKRFETLEQLAQGGFDFEENITIGIHRGPQHLDLDEDVPVNYEFRPKTFVMLYPKKDYSTEMFDREEILAFHHDDILDEESYVEKRTITVKPTEKPKPRATSSSSSSRYREMDYKITVGMDRDSVGDRRLVHDSKSRSSRHDQEVRIRLDSKPDPKYERLYKEQQHQEDRHLLDDEIHRNPSDLRYNLMRKKSGDRDRDRERDRDRDRDRDREWDRDRDRDRDREPDRSRGRDISMMDARARIEAKRKAIGEKSHIVERGPREDSPPQKRFEKRKIGIKTVLPDFKNRPEVHQDLGQSRQSDQGYKTWGFCEICNVPLNSEKQAVSHIHGTQHIANEELWNKEQDRKPAALYVDGRRIDDKSEEEVQEFSRIPATNHDEKAIWIIGTGEMKDFIDNTISTGTLRQALNMRDYSFLWHCARGLLLKDVLPAAKSLLNRGPVPIYIILHVGGNDLGELSDVDFLSYAKDMIESLQSLVPDAKLIWDQLLPRCTGFKDSYTLNKFRREIDDELAFLVLEMGGGYLRFPSIQLRFRHLYEESKDGDLSLSRKGIQTMAKYFTDGARSIILRDMKIVPDMKDLPTLCSGFVRRNIVPAINEARRPFFAKRKKFRT